MRLSGLGLRVLKALIIKNEAELRVSDTFIARVHADKDVLEHVELDKAETEWHKKAIQAEINELQAIIDEKQFSLEKEKRSRDKLQEEINGLKELL
jgi:hypothetical protein